VGRRVHILGASGSGTTTLGQALAARLGCPHHDVDSYFWLPSDPPFLHIRDRDTRRAMLSADLEKPGGWVLSGSLCGWGDIYIPLFDLVVFLWIPPDLRMARLAAREVARYGAETIAPGGAMHAGSVAFMTWAAAYDEGGLEIRSLRIHNDWLATLPGPVLRLEGDASVEANLAAVLRVLGPVGRARQAAGGGTTTSS
jgi:adenylate kinase family enzyme